MCIGSTSLSLYLPLHATTAPQVIAEINTRVAQLVEIAAQLGKLADLAAPAASAGSGEGRAGEAPLSLLALQGDEVPEDREKVRAPAKPLGFNWTGLGKI